MDSVSDEESLTAVVQTPGPSVLEKDTSFGEFEVGSRERLLFYGTPEQNYDLIVFPYGNNINESDLVVRVYDPTGTTVKLENDTGLSFAVGIFGFKPSIEGLYEMEIWNRFFKDGSYGLVFLDKEVKTDDLNQLPNNAQFQDFVSSSQIKYWVIPAVENQTLSATVNPFGATQMFMDLSIQIRDPNGELVLRQEQTNSGEPEIIDDFTFEEAGYYTIWLENKNPIDGEYVMSIK